jgi:hypothetical protein
VNNPKLPLTVYSLTADMLDRDSYFRAYQLNPCYAEPLAECAREVIRRADCRAALGIPSHLE